MGSKVSVQTAIIQDSIFGSNLSRFSSSRDERIEITSKDVHPFQNTCKLLIETQQGKHYVANGFRLNIKPTVSNQQVILTTAHSVFVNGAYARKVTVYFPNQKEQVAYTKQFWAAPEFIDSNDTDYNYGVILLPNEPKNNSGLDWTTLLSDKELNGRPLSTCGYPSDKPDGTLWTAGGGVEKVSEKCIYFMQDSMSTGSGSPVFSWHKGSWVALGIQCYGGVFNTAIRFNPDMIQQVLKIASYSMCYTIQPQPLNNVYLRAEMDEDTGAVDCHFDSTSFDIYPIEMTSSGNNVHIIAPTLKRGTALHVLENDSLPGVAISVVCKLGTAPTSRVFVHHNDDGSASIESTMFPGAYIHVETSQSGGAVAGNVNYQYFSEKVSPGPSERFVLHLKEKLVEL